MTLKRELWVEADLLYSNESSERQSRSLARPGRVDVERKHSHTVLISVKENRFKARCVWSLRGGEAQTLRG